MCRGRAEENSRRSQTLKRLAQGWTVILIGGPCRRFLHIMIDVKLQFVQFGPSICTWKKLRVHLIALQHV